MHSAASTLVVVTLAALKVGAAAADVYSVVAIEAK